MFYSLRFVSVALLPFGFVVGLCLMAVFVAGASGFEEGFDQ